MPDCWVQFGIASKRRRSTLAVVRSRDALIKARTQLINHVRGVMKSVGSRLVKSSTPSFHKKAAETIPESLESVLAPIVETLAKISEQIKNYDRQIEQLSREKYPETELLTQVNGIGQLTALTYVLTLEDPGRFSHSRAVGSFLGLRPRQGIRASNSRSYGSPRRETRCCGDSWSTVRSICWDTSARTVIYGAGAWSWPSEVGKTLRNGRR